MPVLCQRPKRASFISTGIAVGAAAVSWLCQRPKRASFISTATEDISKEENQECVNALNGLLSFLQFKGGFLMFKNKTCQRPKRASFISTKRNF